MNQSVKWIVHLTVGPRGSLAARAPREFPHSPGAQLR